VFPTLSVKIGLNQFREDVDRGPCHELYGKTNGLSILCLLLICKIYRASCFFLWKLQTQLLRSQFRYLHFPVSLCFKLLCEEEEKLNEINYN